MDEFKDYSLENLLASLSAMERLNERYLNGRHLSWKMKVFSNCSGECCVCAFDNVCVAGHGDDDFVPASKEQIIQKLDNGYFPNDREYMIDYLKEKYNVDYKPKEESEGKKMTDRFHQDVFPTTEELKQLKLAKERKKIRMREGTLVTVDYLLGFLTALHEKGNGDMVILCKNEELFADEIEVCELNNSLFLKAEEMDLHIINGMKGFSIEIQRSEKDDKD